MAAAGDDGDEGTPLFCKKPTDLRQRGKKRRCHFGAGHISTGESKRLHAVPDQGIALEFPITDVAIFHQHHPAAPANFVKPFLVGTVFGEMVIVDFDLHPGGAQSRGD